MEEELDIIVEAKAEGERQIRELKDDFQDLRRVIVETAATMAVLTPAMEAMSTAQHAAGSSSRDVGAGLVSVHSVIAPMTVAVIGLAAVLSPVILELGAFAAGLTATLSVIGLAAGGIGLLAGGVLLLAARTGELAGPLGNIQRQFEGVADTLGRAAAPMAGRMLDLISGLLPYVEKLGSELLSWFGPRLEAVLTLSQRAFFGLVEILRQLGRTIDFVITTAMEESEKLAPVLAGTFRFMVAAVDGLVHGLVRLSDWFLDRLPVLGPITANIMSGIGTALMGVLQAAGWLTDFFIANWPAITRAANDTWAAIRDGWNSVAPDLQAFLPEALRALAGLMGYLREHSELVRAALMGVGIAAAAVIEAFALVGLAAVGAVAGLTWLYETTNNIFNALDDAAVAAWRLVGALGAVKSAARDVPVIGGALQILGPPGFQAGGIVPGPIGAPRMVLAHGGEPIGWYGQAGINSGAARSAGTPSTVNYTIHVTATSANPAEVGRQIVQNIQQYERGSGKAWRT